MLEIINEYMLENLFFIVKPFVSYSPWSKRNLGRSNYFWATWNFIIRQSNYRNFPMFYFQFKVKVFMKNYWLFLSNANKSLFSK